MTMTFPANFLYFNFLKNLGAAIVGMLFDLQIIDIKPCSTISDKSFKNIHYKIDENVSKMKLKVFTQYCFWLAFKHFGFYLTDSFCWLNCSWIKNPTHSLNISSVSVILLTKIDWSPRLWTWLTISRLDVIEGLPDHVSSWVSKSPCWKSIHIFFPIEYDVHLSPNVCIIYIKSLWEFSFTGMET